MEKKPAISIYGSFALTTLVVVGLIITVYTFPTVLQSHVAMNVAVKILDILAFIVSLLYCFTGYKKDSMKFFFAFCIVYTLDIMICIIWEISSLNSNLPISIFNIIMQLIQYGALSIFSVALNLGKKKSFILAAIIVICEIIELVAIFGNNMIFLLPAISKTALALSFAIMVYAKYQDKAARGTK